MALRALVAGAFACLQIAMDGEPESLAARLDAAMSGLHPLRDSSGGGNPVPQREDRHSTRGTLISSAPGALREVLRYISEDHRMASQTTLAHQTSCRPTTLDK